MKERIQNSLFLLGVKMKLSLYSVDEDYLEYLRKYDSKISYTLNIKSIIND